MSNLAQTQKLATRLRSLHVPGKPIVFPNIWDAPSATAAAGHPSTKALTTASWAIAAVNGTADPDLTWAINIRAIRTIAAAVAAANPETPLAADVQDGYADVAGTVRELIGAGVVGCNLEDLSGETGGLRPLEEAVERVRTAVAAAKEAGVPDFVVNARTDVLYQEGGTVRDVIERGTAFLAAGATTVYVWGGTKGRGVSKEEVKEIAGALGGMVNVKMNLREGFLNARDIGALGVARISVGPELYRKSMEGFNGAMDRMLKGESF